MINIYKFIFLCLLISSCRKNDCPKILIFGDNPYYMELGTNYVDGGFTADDEQDGDITANVKWSDDAIDKNKSGNYLIYYSITDVQKCSSKATRQVVVYNKVDFLNGTYSVMDSSISDGSVKYYLVYIQASSIVNKKLSIKNFGDFGDLININGTFDNDVSLINFPANQALGGTSLLLNSVGYLTNSSGQRQIIINYTWKNGNLTYNHVATLLN